MTAPVPGRRLADRLLDEGSTIARQYAEQNRWDPTRPPLGVLVAEALALAERRGEQRTAASRDSALAAIADLVATIDLLLLVAPPDQHAAVRDLADSAERARRLVTERGDRAGRCPDTGYCHGSRIDAGSPPCPEGTCYRVRTSWPLSIAGFPGNRWPDRVLRANGLDVPEFPREEVERAERYVLDGLDDALGDPTRPNGYTLAVIRARRDAREEALRPFRNLFSGGPDTPCRTTWRSEGGAAPELEVPPTECVEVPLDEVRAALVEAGDSPS